MIYDVVIIGAGPAGSYAGCLLAKAGLKVALVDRAEFPREKLCGGLLTCKTVELLQFVCQPQLLSKFDVVQAHVFYQECLSASVQLFSPTYTIRRIQFDNLLAETAKKFGCHIYFGAPLHSIDFVKKEVCLFNGKILRYTKLIGADGVHSKVRRLAGLTKNEMGFCLQTHVPWTLLKTPERLESGGIEIFYGDYPCGYSWIFPCKDSVAVGVGALEQKVSAKDTFNQYQQFLEKVLSSTKGVRILGAYIPSGTSVVLGTHQNKNLCLIGDAAGLIDPFTGEGLYYALLSAKAAATSIMSGSSHFLEYKEQMHSVIKSIQDTISIRNHIYEPAVLRHLISFLRGASSYCEQLIDETILRYIKSYKDAHKEIEYYNR